MASLGPSASPIDRIPPEILTEILTYLLCPAPRTLLLDPNPCPPSFGFPANPPPHFYTQPQRALPLVSRLWHALATPLLPHTVRIRTHAQARLVADAFAQDPSAGERVRALLLWQPGSPPYDALVAVVRACPNIEALNVALAPALTDDPLLDALAELQPARVRLAVRNRREVAHAVDRWGPSLKEIIFESGTAMSLPPFAPALTHVQLDYDAEALAYLDFERTRHAKLVQLSVTSVKRGPDEGFVFLWATQIGPRALTTRYALELKGQDEFLAKGRTWSGELAKPVELEWVEIEGVGSNAAET